VADIGDETADVLILLASIANRCGIDIETAFRLKEGPERIPDLDVAHPVPQQRRAACGHSAADSDDFWPAGGLGAVAEPGFRHRHPRPGAVCAGRPGPQHKTAMAPKPLPRPPGRLLPVHPADLGGPRYAGTLIIVKRGGDITAGRVARLRRGRWLPGGGGR
jgi:hypothetical protein